MALGDFKFDPEGGWNDTSKFPSYPARDQVRPLMQKLFDQIKTWLNGDVKTFVNGIDTALTSHKAESTLYESEIVKIPSDYLTLQLAVDTLSKKRPAQGKIIKLLIETGHALTGGLLVRHGDYSHFEIVSEDATVYLDPAFVGATAPAEDDGIGFIAEEDSVIVGINASMPTLACLIDMENTHGSGYYGVNSKGLVKSGCGVINAGLRGAYCMASHFDMRGSNFSGATSEGFRAQHGATADLMAGNFDNCCKDGVSEAAIYVSKGCLVGARELTAQNSGTNGLMVRRSKVDAELSNFSGAKGITFNQGYGIAAEGMAEISATGAIANNGRIGVYATQLSLISGGVTAKNNTVNDIEVYHGSMIMGYETTSSNVSGNYPDLADTNINAINMPTKNGMIISQSQPSMIEYGTNANGSYIKFAEGTQITISTLITVNITLSANEVSSLLTKPAEVLPFTTKLYGDIQAIGRETVDGGGGRIGLDVYARGIESVDTFRVRNSGINTLTTATNTTVNCVQYNHIIVGRWK